jgi:D-glycero-D-manno-heptose 1,7-bisphosphate phosphatase
MPHEPTVTPKRPLPQGAAIDAEGVWVQKLGADAGRGRRPALFLDRDGVVVDEVGYLQRVEDTRLVAGAGDLVAAANRRRIRVVVVTNQGGIAHGYYGWDAFMAVQEKMLAELAAAGAFVDAVLACPFHPEGKPPYRHPDHPARKPRPGMLLKAGELWPVDFARSWIVGDRASDLMAGKSAGLAGGVIVPSGHGLGDEERARSLALADAAFTALAAAAVADALALIPLLKGS